MKIYITIVATSLLFAGCKSDFLDAKPSSSIVNPTKLSELQSLLDNNSILNTTGALGQVSCDEYFVVSMANFSALDEISRNTCTWQKDLFGGSKGILDWNQLYKSVFYANSVLDALDKIEVNPFNITEWNNIKGSALFFRAYSYFDLARNFCLAYDEKTATTDLGLPLRTSAAIDRTLPRSTLLETYAQIIQDLGQSKELLRDGFSELNRNRPSRCATFAMLARVNLYMGRYTEANLASEACLSIYNTLINYNSISTTSATPFTYTSKETIFYSTQLLGVGYTTLTTYNSRPAIGVDTNLLKLYDQKDLRFPIYFLKNAIGNYNAKRGYVGGGLYAFTGLAVDEVMLIQAECLARKGDFTSAMDILNNLLATRWIIDPVTQKSSYVKQIVTTGTEALDKILTERRKELVWRGLRWSDIKRLNRAGANILLKRKIEGTEFILAPNSPLYTFPIPDEEIQLSGIIQNKR